MEENPVKPTSGQSPSASDSFSAQTVSERGVSKSTLRLSRVLAVSLALAVSLTSWQPFGSTYLLERGLSLRGYLIPLIWILALAASSPKRVGRIPSQGVWAASWLLLVPLSLFCLWRYSAA